MDHSPSSARLITAVAGAGVALLAAAAALAVGGIAPAAAAPKDYADGIAAAASGAGLDQLPAPVSAKGLEVIGHSDLNQARGNTSDVWYLNGVAFLGYRCAEDKGSSIVDVSDPANPQVLFQTDVMSRTFANDVKALHMETASFSGDVLVEAHDRCRASGPPARTRLWDVSDPKAPQLLGAIVTGDGVHDVYAFQRGDNAYVLVAAPFADTADNSSVGYEDVDLDADFAIADITDPRNPVVVGKYNLRQELGRLPGSVFLHDVAANSAGTLAYAAWWDAGMILFDISDVTAPRVVSRLSYLDRGAGNTHAAVPAKNDDYVVITDEDFGPTDGLFEVLTPPDIAGRKASNAGNFANMLIGQPLAEGDLVWVGRGCQVDPAYPGIVTDDPYLNDATGKIAVIVRGDCSFANKILRAQKEGAIAAVIVNHTPGGGPPPMGGGDGAITIPGTGIAYEDGNAMTMTLESGVGVRARFGVVAGEWGFTRLADYRDPANPKLIGEYTI
ncbi:MAG: PA domain-containing protein, partial [Anaerolineae bacterium]